MARENIRLQSASPSELYSEEWLEVQKLMRYALSSAGLPRTQEEIDYLLHWGDLYSFRESRVEPGSGSFNPNQSFANLQTVRAFDGADLVGYLYCADNTSGSPLLRWSKMRLPHLRHKKYAWLREVATHPEYQGQHVASALGYLALKDKKPKQGVSAYVWRENEAAMAAAASLEMEATDSQYLQVFGEGTEPVEQIRYASSVYDLTRELLKRSELAKLAISRTKTQRNAWLE